MNFTQKLKNAVRSANSILCVGLDPSLDKIPDALKKEYSRDTDLVFEFCRRIVETTKMDACAYKPNLAFFEALGSDGWKVFEDIVDIIPSDKILIADAKRGDIGNTAQKYKEAFFDRLNVDAITLNPLMGLETLEPFISDEEKAIFVLTMTSNRGAADFLQRRFEGRMSLGGYIAEELEKKQEKSLTHLGMVVGATSDDPANEVVKNYPGAHLLIPGIGAQGGSVQTVEYMLKNHKGIPIISSSRSIIYAGSGQENWIDHVRQKAIEMKENVKQITANYVG